MAEISIDRVKDIVRRLMEEMLTLYKDEFKQACTKLLRGERKVVRYKAPDLNLIFDAELKEDGEVIVHWEPLEHADIEIEAKAADLDRIMMNKMSVMRAVMSKKLKVKGSIREMMRLSQMIPVMQKAYREGREKLSKELGIDIDKLLEALEKM
ncbi:MAG: SCP2 sterol-binding domain-containing protein [Candidatus Baldrarchaeia archaeon]